ncbi:N-acetylglucosamine-6-phosphate deacetylase [Polaromonas sp.]|uniref:N-acetylglucosamine-6-phosphate deacetylase n=1 Tax=Polaromonas sp. TaxID=1869339 RepID=UPI002FC88202
MIAGAILTPDGFVQGKLHIDHATGRVASIVGRPIAQDAVLRSGLPWVLPGFIDTHVHGAGGADVMQGRAALPTIARTVARHGTTAFLATTMTAPADELAQAVAGVGAYMREAAASRQQGAARVLGVHLEGPYLNSVRLGAQPDFVRHAALAELGELCALAPIALLTLAPEVDDHVALIPALRERNIRVQLGHSNASYEEACAALAGGAGGFTHLFNAMSALHHRAPGMVGAALAHAEFAEVIPDLLHVHPGGLRVALRSIPKLFCVSDSTAATGMPDGPYLLGRQAVHKCLGGVRLADGTLAGSTLTLDQALRNLVHEIGLTVAEASMRVSTYAADYLGLTERGRLCVGAYADMVVLNAGLEVRQVMVEGVKIELADV